MSKRRPIGTLLRHAIFHNFWLKLISLMFALGFYSLIHSARYAQRSFSVTLLRLMPAPETKRLLVTDIPRTITVTISGSRQQLDRLRNTDIDPIQLDLTAGQDLPRQELTPSMITGLPPGVRVERLTPARLKVQFENEVSRPVDIRISTSGNPAKHMEIKQAIKLNPAKVVATGPKSAVEVLQFIPADPFDVEGLGTGTHIRVLLLDLPPVNVDYSQLTVEATLEIGLMAATRKFEDIKVSVLGIARARTSPARVDVTITGVPDRVNGLKALHIVPRVQAVPTGDEIGVSGSVMADVFVDLEDLDVKIEPDQVQVKW